MRLCWGLEIFEGRGGLTGFRETRFAAKALLFPETPGDPRPTPREQWQTRKRSLVAPLLMVWWCGLESEKTAAGCSCDSEEAGAKEDKAGWLGGGEAAGAYVDGVAIEAKV